MRLGILGWYGTVRLREILIPSRCIGSRESFLAALALLFCQHPDNHGSLTI